MRKERDLNHKSGNETHVNLIKKKVMTDPHTHPGKLAKGIKKITQPGWKK